MKWFRFYDDVVNDPKVQRLPAELFRAWVNMLCIASKNGGNLPADSDDLAYILHSPVVKVRTQLQALTEAGLLDQAETLRPHNWSARQYQSDSSTPRVKAFRERQEKRPCNVSGNVSVTAAETPPDTDTDTDTEQNREEPPVSPPLENKPRGRKPRAKACFPDDWLPGKQGREYAVSLGLNPDTEGPACRNSSIAKGREYANFDAAFRTWCDNAIKFAARDAGQGQRGQVRRNPASVASIIAEVIEAGDRGRAGNYPDPVGETDLSGGGNGPAENPSGDGFITIDHEPDRAGTDSVPERHEEQGTGRDRSEDDGGPVHGRAAGLPGGYRANGAQKLGAGRDVLAGAGGDSQSLSVAIGAAQEDLRGDDPLDIPAFLRRLQN